MNAGEFILAAPRERQDRSGRIRMHPSGLYVNPLDLKPEDIRLADIAHHLAMICRYTGACPYHYSVAQHSVLVTLAAMQRMGPIVDWDTMDFLRACLMHDASEAYLNDIASPVKHSEVMRGYRDAEAYAMAMIFSAFNIPPELLGATKEFDDAVFRAEVASFWGGADNDVRPMTPDDAERYFLACATDLGFT